MDDSIFTDIDRWEEITIIQVRTAADNARKRVDELKQKTRSQLQRDYEQLSQELRHRKENDDYFEHDLDKLTTQLEQLKLSITNTADLIKIRSRSIDWLTVLETEARGTETGNVVPTQNVSEKHIEKTKHETAALFDGTSLLSAEHQLKVNEFYGQSKQRWKLIYQASRDGFGVKDFHSRCDDQGETMIVIRSENGYLFGASNRVPWRSEGGWIEDESSFLFTLTNPHTIPPTKYHIHPHESAYSMYHRADCGPLFGRGHDLWVSHRSNENSKSCTRFPRSFMDTTGKGMKTFTGDKHFRTSDIEVFRLVQ
ncbi:unnamed protein product [Didymodactylos carnosus]|uniref:TLDc domain-containing protein n=1 Tax=Didymodactylos carnosus TaxID=1234261 RepID=A0A815GLK0_9BILA|nr:unnamed protein product [Didymodactylos carnosus]CAF1341696.1 unnamed protein product [Didymodactylos carnosus]CAF3849358.1 unnamed protein product [Didymodactylos carnosus]CAF4203452.1 unnamed protein product [Didymodactylos carnosus]